MRYQKQFINARDITVKGPITSNTFYLIITLLEFLWVALNAFTYHGKSTRFPNIICSVRSLRIHLSMKSIRRYGEYNTYKLKIRVQCAIASY